MIVVFCFNCLFIYYKLILCFFHYLFLRFLFNKTKKCLKIIKLKLNQNLNNKVVCMYCKLFSNFIQIFFQFTINVV